MRAISLGFLYDPHLAKPLGRPRWEGHSGRGQNGGWNLEGCTDSAGCFGQRIRDASAIRRPIELIEILATSLSPAAPTSDNADSSRPTSLRPPWARIRPSRKGGRCP